jgi:acyl carrier protein
MSLNCAALLDYFQNRLGIDVAGVDDTTPLFSSSLLDSFSIVEVITFIESQAAIRFDAWDVSLDNLDTIERILNYVHQKRKSA